MTKRVLPHAQVADVGFLRKVYISTWQSGVAVKFATPKIEPFRIETKYELPCARYVAGSAILAMTPVRHRPQGPCSQGAPNMNVGIQYSYSLPTHYDGCPTLNAIFQGSTNSGSRDLPLCVTKYFKLTF